MKGEKRDTAAAWIEVDVLCKLCSERIATIQCLDDGYVEAFKFRCPDCLVVSAYKRKEEKIEGLHALAPGQERLDGKKKEVA